MNAFRATVISLSLISFAFSALGADEKLSPQDLEGALLGKVFTLFQAQNVSARQYYQLGKKEFLCRHKLTGLFPNSQDVSNVSITRIRQMTESEVLSRNTKFEGNRMVSKDRSQEFRFWVFTLKHPYLGKGELRLTCENGDLPSSKQEIMSLLGFVLAGDDLPRHNLVCGNKGSQLAHFVGSGHSPRTGEQGVVEFPGITEATEAGLKPCSLCFNRKMTLAHFRTERELGKETEATIRHYYQISKELLMQERIDRLGRKVLANWPNRLVGYDYRFNVIEDGAFNAVACAGGYVFVHRGLVNLVESDEELEAVLAHEIAHVEQRHGIKELIRAKRSANAAAVFGAVVTGAAAAAAASANSQQAAIIAESAGAIVLLASAVGAQIAMQGYSREHELEADIFTLNYCESMGYDRKHLLSVLAKIRSSIDLENPRSSAENDLSSSHPSPISRLYVANNIKVDRWKNEATFDAFNKEGELLYSMQFQGTCSYQRRDGSEYCKILFTVSSTAALSDNESVEVLTMAAKNLKREFRSDEPYELVPMDHVGMAFTYRGALALKPEDISEPRLEGIKAARVVRRN